MYSISYFNEVQQISLNFVVKKTLISYMLSSDFFKSHESWQFHFQTLGYWTYLYLKQHWDSNIWDFSFVIYV